MNKSQLRLDVPKFIIQIIVTFIIVYLIYSFLLRDWITNIDAPFWITGLLEMMILFFITVPFFYLIVYRDITKKINADHKLLEEMAYFDSLTGLSNRHYFIEKSQKILEEAEKKQERVALLYLDLDRLKVVNDNLGHFAGDELLQQTAKRLREMVGELGIVSRLGGDEFAILYSFGKNSEQEVLSKTNGLLAGFHEPFQIDGYAIHSKLSIGIAIFPDHGKTNGELLEASDTAMFQAKRLGGNQYKLYNPSYAVSSQQIFDIENDFFEALKNQDLFLVYQPRVDSLTLDTISVEALIRWKHPEKGTILPEKFIKIAETTGQIIQMGEWVLKEACQQLKSWQKEGHRKLRMAVNISEKQLQHRDFPNKVQAILQDTGVAAKDLELEISNLSLLDENEIVYCGICKLREIGIHLALDDFGIGYSPLRLIKGHRLHALNIDKEFIENVDQDDEKAAVLQSIAMLARGLKIEVVAKGVETKPELEFLQHNGFNLIQGNYIAAPAKAEQLSFTTLK
ncbi:EAL domain-containing protein [Bacillus sp. DNRA2]|uniref:EAL domain-containing protein n=1 Tax=Bacillus sp. DNRA2 TaxID=2723053 RepID=UPI00145E91A9|nr:EAL domain-containing protein [Bacillus sp. DNRA2]